MDGERLVESLFYKRLTGQYIDLFRKAASEGYVLCIPQTVSLDSPVITTADIGVLSSAGY
jgi:hypothetical protein